MAPFVHLTGLAVVIDVSTKAARDPDYMHTRAGIAEWESAQGRISNEAIINQSRSEEKDYEQGSAR